MIGEIIVSLLLAAFVIGFGETVRRVTLARVKRECGHPLLERYGANTVVCVECDRVWTLTKRTWDLRGGPGHDFPCERPEATECSLSRCLERRLCQYNVRGHP